MPEVEEPETKYDVTVYLVKDGPLCFTEIKKKQRDEILDAIANQKYYQGGKHTLIMSKHVVHVRAREHKPKLHDFDIY